MPLTEADIDRAIPGPSPFKLGDGGGLYLLVNPNGSKYWRMKFRYAQREKTLAFGVYPKISIEAARKARDTAKALLAQGEDPSHAKRDKDDVARADRLAALASPRLSLGMNGNVEIWKGRAVVRLTDPEARTVNALLTRILGDTPCR
jgi:hypothetical protein